LKTERIAIDARTSTVAGQSPQMQLQELTEYAERRGFQIVEEYVDHGSSGSRESRPALDRLMNDARRRKFDAVLVWKIDRFGAFAEAPREFAGGVGVRGCGVHQSSRQP
jgi:DNA invertase Pin-like site-specific DNA recombinase